LKNKILNPKNKMNDNTNLISFSNLAIKASNLQEVMRIDNELIFLTNLTKHLKNKVSNKTLTTDDKAIAKDMRDRIRLLLDQKRALGW
jgi:anti-sigma28 factor (negative regulator of flagellin synthesis)